MQQNIINLYLIWVCGEHNMTYILLLLSSLSCDFQNSFTYLKKCSQKAKKIPLNKEDANKY